MLKSCTWYARLLWCTIGELVNEAALFAARRNKNTVDMHDFEDAKDKIYMGLNVNRW
jgi:ATP-dependent Zn protease